MEQQWSGKKFFFFLLAFFAVAVGVAITTHSFPIGDIPDIVELVIGGISWIITLVLLMFACMGVLLGVILTLMERGRKRKAKERAYTMIEGGRVYHDWFEEVASVLRRCSDREGRHLLNDLYELKKKLEQIPDEQTEENALIMSIPDTKLDEYEAEAKKTKNKQMLKLIMRIRENRAKKVQA